MSERGKPFSLIIKETGSLTYDPIAVTLKETQFHFTTFERTYTI